jgi:nitrogen fixation NifU-like protein
MSELRELYQEVILDHNKRPRNFHKLEDANHRADGHNPLCGDNVSIYVLVNDGIIRDISFEGGGCAISKASASLMTSLVKGKSIDEAEKLFGMFHDLVTSSGPIVDIDSLGKLAVFSGVREYPARVKCASLAWHTLHAALTNPDVAVTTE